MLAFLDSDNKVLKQMFVSVATGKAALLDLTLSDLGGDSGSHRQETKANISALNVGNMNGEEARCAAT